MRLVLAAAIAALVATPASAAQWNVDYAKSRLGFTVQWSDAPFVAVFKSWKAEVSFDPADLAHSHVVTLVDLSSETSDTADNDDGVKGPQGFQVSTFPQARFETTGFARKAANLYLARAKLTLHGVTKPLTLPFTLIIDGDTAHMTGKAVLMRTDFGVGQGEWGGETPVAHAVTVTVDLTATRAR